MRAKCGAAITENPVDKLGWRELNSLRLQKKISDDSLPQNLKYVSIPSFFGFLSYKNFHFCRSAEFLPPNFLCGEVRVCSKAVALQKQTQTRADKGGERNRKGFDSRQPIAR